MLIRLDPSSPHPVYRQIADAITAHIEDGRLLSGDRLPAARLLAEALDINMHTVLRAYEYLDGLGLVDKRRGRGGVVVAEGAGIEEMARRLAATARKQGLNRSDLLRLVEESW